MKKRLGCLHAHHSNIAYIETALTRHVEFVHIVDQILMYELTQLADSKMLIKVSYRMIESLHEDRVYLLKSLTAEQLQRVFLHSDTGLVTLECVMGLYAWYGKYHLTHIHNALVK